MNQSKKPQPPRNGPSQLHGPQADSARLHVPGFITLKKLIPQSAHNSPVLEPRAPASQTRRPPAAPPVYRPQPIPKVLQARMGSHHSAKQLNRASGGPGAPEVYRSQATPVSVQPRMPNGAMIRKPPVQLPDYRPQRAPNALQTKSSLAQAPGAGQVPRRPIAPPIYRPEAKKIIQPKAISQLRKLPTAPPVYRPEQRRVAQPKMASATPAHTPPNGPDLRTGRSMMLQRRLAIEATHAGRSAARDSRLPGVIQRVMAYRVEYPSYKIQYDEQSKKVTGFLGNDDGYGINISFVLPDHSTYFASERNESQLKGLRLVTFELDDDLWAAIEWKASGKGKKKDLKQKWAEMVDSLKSPSWSDGSNLTKFIKQTALAFDDHWLPVLKKGIKGTASVEYLEDSEEGLGEHDSVFGYNTGEENEGVELPMVEATAQYDQFMTVGKAKRLGYI